jgi:hypothetical protein
MGWEGTPDLDVLRQMFRDGHTMSEIAQVTGRSLYSVTNRCMREKADGLTRLRTVTHQQASGQAARRSHHPPPIDSTTPPWLEDLRPVAMPAPKPAKRTTAPGDFTLAIGDLHFPQHDPATISVFLETVSQLRPRRVILNGDTVDLLAVSKYPKDQRHTWSLREEVVAFHEFLHQLVSIGNAWDMELIETEANHSGNGTASRWHRYLSDRVPALYAHPEAEAKLSYQSWFYPDWAPISLQENVVIADDLMVFHGDIVRKHAGYSARAHGEKWHSSVMHSHTHRMGSGVERIPSVGTRAEHVRRVYEIGCACNLTPSYVSAPNWTNGFAIIHHDADELGYGVELVTVTNRAAAVATLGCTVRAA